MQDTARPTRSLHSHQVSTPEKDVVRFSSPMDIGTGSNIFDKVFPGWPTGVKSKAAKNSLNNTPDEKVSDAVALRKIWSTRRLGILRLRRQQRQFIGQLPVTPHLPLLSLSDLIIIGDDHGSENFLGFEIVLSSNNDGVDEVHLGGGGHSESDEKHFGGINDPRSRAFPGATGGEKDSGTTTPSTIASSLFDYAEVDYDNADTIVDVGEGSWNVHIGIARVNSGVQKSGRSVIGLGVNSTSENTGEKKFSAVQAIRTSTKTIAIEQPETGVTTLPPTIPEVPQFVNEYDDEVPKVSTLMEPEMINFAADLTLSLGEDPNNLVDSIRDGAKRFIEACDFAQNSERLRKLLLHEIISLVNGSANATINFTNVLRLLIEEKSMTPEQTPEDYESDDTSTMYTDEDGFIDGFDELSIYTHESDVFVGMEENITNNDYRGQSNDALTRSQDLLAGPLKESGRSNFIKKMEVFTAKNPENQLILQVTEHGNIEKLSLQEISYIPKPNRSTDVVIKVDCSTINIQDCMIRRGKWHEMPRLPFVPGSDFVGTIHELGSKASKCSTWQVGDRVAAMARSGGNAKYVTVDYCNIMHVPPEVNSERALCLSSTYVPALEALELGRKLNAPFTGANVLVVGGNEPTGLAAIELALLEGAHVFTTADERHHKHLTKLGARCFLTEQAKWLPTLTGKMDVVLDSVVLDSGKSSSLALNSTGTLVLSEALGFSMTENRVNNAINYFLTRAEQMWDNAVLYDRMAQFALAPLAYAQHFRYLCHLASKGLITPLVSARGPLNKVASLQRAIELGETTCGICVCTPWTTKSASKYGSKDETSDDCDEVSGNVNIGTVGTNSGGSAVSGLRINSASENTNDKKSPSLQTRETSTNTVAFKQHGKEVTTLSLTEMSHADQVTLIDSDPPIEEEDVKSFKMGTTAGTMLQVSQKEENDPSIIDRDQRKSYTSQVKSGACDVKMDAGPPLKDDPECSKYFKMIKVGIPLGAVQHALLNEGKDPDVINLDPNKPLSRQQQSKAEGAQMSFYKIRHKIGEPKLSENSLRDQATEQSSIQVVGVDIDNVEVASFTSPLNKTISAPPQGEASDESQPSSNQKLQLIDGRRRMKSKMLKVGISKGPVMQALQKEKRHYFSQMLKIGISPGSVMQVFQKERRHYFNKTVKMGISPHLGRRALSRARLLPSVSCILASLTRTMHALSSVDLDKDEVASLFPSPLNYTPSAPPNEVASNAKKPIPKQNVQLINRRCGTVNEPKEFIAIHPIFINADRVEKIESNTPFKVEYAESCKMGMPTGKILQAMQTKGKDPSIIDLDQKKSYNVHDVKMDAGPPLKDDPEFSKYFKKGKDPNVINLEPDKPLSSQQQPKPKKAQMHSKFIGPKVARKRLHWTEIDESKLSENSFWNQAKINSSLQLVGLDFNEEEFASLFTAPLNETPLAPPNEEVSDEKKPAPKQKVQLIDSRRRMNGELLLNRLKVNNAVLARQVDRMEFIDAEGYELQGLMQLLPTKNETLVLRNYLPPHDASQSEYDESIAKLGECEQYMAVMLGVDDVKNKFQAMVFRAEFDDLVEKIRDGTNILIHACDCVKKSERFCKLLLYALKLGNALNSDGSNKEVTAITIGSLLKFPEAKALDHKTTMLHYLILILQKNDEDVLKLSEDFLPVKAAERVSMHVLDQQLREMEKGIESVKDVLTRHLIDHPLDETQMTQFSLSAESKIQSLIDGFTNAKMNFANLLQFFGEVKSMTSEEFFRAIDNFVSMFDRTHEELKRKEEAKLRKKRIEEKQWLREQEIAAKKIESIKLLELDRDTSNGRC